jgi:hypothetical protein
VHATDCFLLVTRTLGSCVWATPAVTPRLDALIGTLSNTDPVQHCTVPLKAARGYFVHLLRPLLQIPEKPGAKHLHHSLVTLRMNRS